MKVLIIANFDVGLYKFRRELIAELLARSCEVVIALPYGELVDKLTAMGCRFIDTPLERRGMNPLHDLSLMRLYSRIIRAEKPDLCITYTIKPNIYGGMALARAHVRHAANITGLGTAFESSGLLRGLVTFLYKRAFRKTETVFFENDGNRDVILKAHIIDQARAFTNPGAGVNLDEYSPLPYPPDGQLQFIFIGRVMREKGIGELFDAIIRLRKNGYDARLHILGLPEEDYTQRLAQLCADGAAVDHGYVTDVRKYISDAHCFVLPSYHEGMANTLLECAACARPLITSDIFGCREAVADGENGYLCTPRDADSLYAALEKFAKLSYEEKKRMGERSREIIAERFDRNAVVADTLNRMGIPKPADGDNAGTRV